MRKGQDIIPMAQNRFPGTVAFVETFDTDESTAEPADILSFESLREAFVTLRTNEVEFPAELQPDYEMDTTIDVGGEDRTLPPDTKSPVVVNARLETIIEAMLFVGNQENRPLCPKQIAEKLRNVSADEVEQTVIRLNEHYRERNCPYMIISEQDGYRMVLRSEFEPVRVNFYGKVRETRLSQQVIDTLAIVAYRQPITVEEIQSIRQQSCSAVLNQLVRRNLLKISREVQDKKSVVRYHTTVRFLDLCQIKSLDDLPRIDELDYQ